MPTFINTQQVIRNTCPGDKFPLGTDLPPPILNVTISGGNAKLTKGRVATYYSFIPTSSP